MSNVLRPKLFFAFLCVYFESVVSIAQCVIGNHSSLSNLSIRHSEYNLELKLASCAQEMDPRTLLTMLFFVCCYSKYDVTAAFAANHFLGTCLTQSWVQSVERELGIDAKSRDTQARLVNPFLSKALHKQRYRLEDPRTKSSAVYLPSCLPSDAKIFGSGATVDANGNVIDCGTVDGTVILEINGWVSHSLATMIFAILATEVLGYAVSLAEIFNTADIAQRMSSVGQALCTPTHVNMEVWVAGKEIALNTYANESTSLGSVGYAGLVGMRTTAEFAAKALNTTSYPNGPYYPLYWQGYKLDEPLIQAVPISVLKNNSQHYPPAQSGCADGVLGCLNSCAKTYACTLREAAGGECLVIAMMYYYYDRGYFQAVMSNIGVPTYFCFLSYDGVQNYALDMHAQGKPVLFVHYEPDVFHVQYAGLFERVFLPRSDPENVALATSTFGENGYGQPTNNPVNTDFPTTLLAKYSAQFLVDQGSRLGNLLAKYSLTELQMKTVMRSYINASNVTTDPDPYFTAACGWIRENYASWIKWIDRLPLCTFDQHIEHVVTGCNDSSRMITFSWASPDPDNSSLPYNCDGGLTALPMTLRTSRPCDWIAEKETTWINWLQEQPACDATFFKYNVTECDAASKRTVKYYWLLPDPMNASQSHECDMTSFTLPNDVSIDCEYMPTTSPLFAVIAALDIIIAILLAVAMILVYRNRQAPIVKRSQFELLELMIFGGVLVCAAILLYAGKPSAALCALRPVLISCGFTTIFGALIVKSLRVYRVFMKSTMKRRNIPTSSMIKIFALFCTVDVVIIGAWFIADFPGPETTDTRAQEFDGYVERVACNASGIFSILLMFWKAIVLFAGLYMSFLIRHVSADFQESFWMFASALVVLVGSLVILPLAYLVNLPATAFYVFLAGSLMLCTSLIMGFMLGPKAIRIHESSTKSSYTGISVKRVYAVPSGSHHASDTTEFTSKPHPSDYDETATEAAIEPTAPISQHSEG